VSNDDRRQLYRDLSKNIRYAAGIILGIFGLLLKLKYDHEDNGLDLFIIITVSAGISLLVFSFILILIGSRKKD